MSSKQRRVDRAVDRFMDLDSTSYGDERERSVFMEAATFGWTLAIYANLFAAIVAAVLGALAVPIVLLALMAVPAFSTIFYAGRQGVAVDELADGASIGRKLAVIIVVFGGMAMVLAAMTYTVFTGHGLIQLPSAELTGPEASGLGASMLRGGVLGGFGGAFLGLIAVIVLPFLKSRRAAVRADDDGVDEE